MVSTMNGIMDIVWIVIALGVIGTVIWAFQAYVTIPGPFAWLKGVLTFVLVVVGCYFIWTNFLVGHFHQAPLAVTSGHR
jgi:hypothetical protein